MGNRFCLGALTLILTGVFAHGQDPEHEPQGPVTTVGDPRSPDELPNLIASAYRNGFRRINIKSGVYHFKPTHHPLIVLDHWNRARLSGHGVTLISSDKEQESSLIQLRECTDLELIDLTLSQEDPVAYQGKVSQVSTDPNGRPSCIWTPDDGYPTLPHDAVQMTQGPNVVDGKTRQLKVGVGDQWDASLTSNGDGRFKVSFARNLNLANGDWLVSRYGASPFKVDLVQSRGCTLGNITLLRNGFAAIREQGGGGNSYYDCHWLLGPKPDNATEKPLVTSSADGFHSTGAYPGPDIENSDFSGILLDDCIAIHGEYQKVRQSQGSTIVLEPGNAMLAAGQPIRISAVGYIANGFVQTLKENADKSLTAILDKDLAVPVGARVTNPLHNGQSFKILNCHLGGARSRGILAKADSGIIENNSIVSCGMSAVSAGPEYSWNEGDYVRDLTIRANQFKANGFIPGDHPTVFVHGEGAIGNFNVTVENNGFEGNLGGDVSINWTSLVTVKSNIFTAPSSLPIGFRRPTPVTFSHCKGVKVLDNLAKNESLYSTPWIAPGSDVFDLESQGGRGIHTGT